MNKEHFIKLKNRYEAAPINQIFNPTININLGACTLKMKVTKKLYVAVPAAHGLVAFKMLDDAAWGAASSFVLDVFVFTANFNIDYLKPLKYGNYFSEGKVIDQSEKKINVESKLYDNKRNIVAKGSGLFMKSKHLLEI